MEPIVKAYRSWGCSGKLLTFSASVILSIAGPCSHRILPCTGMHAYTACFYFIYALLASISYMHCLLLFHTCTACLYICMFSMLLLLLFVTRSNLQCTILHILKAYILTCTFVTVYICRYCV